MISCCAFNNIFIKKNSIYNGQRHLGRAKQQADRRENMASPETKHPAARKHLASLTLKATSPQESGCKQQTSLSNDPQNHNKSKGNSILYTSETRPSLHTLEIKLKNHKNHHWNSNASHIKKYFYPLISIRHRIELVLKIMRSVINL